MPGRYALIVSQDAAGLADFLEEDGGFEVQTTVNPNEVAAFAAAREAADVVLVAIDGDPRATVSALEACASTHVLVIAENEIAAEPAKGRAFLTGAPLRVVGRELRSGRADKDKDGEVLVRELYQRLRQNHQPRLRSSLDTAFVVARNPQRVDARERIRRQRNRDGQGFTRGGRQRPLVAAGAVLALAALPLAWLYGGSGLDLAFAAGTAWPNRIAPLAGVALALVAIPFLLRRLSAGWVVFVAGFDLGALVGFLQRFDSADYGPGYFLALAAPLPILLATWRQAEHESSGWLAGVGTAVVGYQLVGGNSWSALIIGACIAAFAAWVLGMIGRAD